jgi:hypothetical protein
MGARGSFPLILFIKILSLLLKKHVHLTCSNDICHFYILDWRNLLQPSLEENSIHIKLSLIPTVFGDLDPFQSIIDWGVSSSWLIFL